MKLLKMFRKRRKKCSDRTKKLLHDRKAEIMAETLEELEKMVRQHKQVA